MCVVCKIIGSLVALVLLLATVAAALGVWTAHHDASGMWVFGTMEASVSLVVLVITAMAFKKTAHKMCGCGKMGGCGGGKCGCGDGGGMCPMCHKSPCVCK